MSNFILNVLGVSQQLRSFSRRQYICDFRCRPSSVSQMILLCEVIKLFVATMKAWYHVMYYSWAINTSYKGRRLDSFRGVQYSLFWVTICIQDRVRQNYNVGISFLACGEAEYIQMTNFKQCDANESLSSKYGQSARWTYAPGLYFKYCRVTTLLSRDVITPLPLYV